MQVHFSSNPSSKLRASLCRRLIAPSLPARPTQQLIHVNARHRRSFTSARLGHQDLSDRRGPEVEQGRAEGKTDIVRRNNVNAFIPLRWSPTPVVAPAQTVTVAETPLAVGTGAETFLQGVLAVPGVVDFRRYIAIRLSA